MVTSFTPLVFYNCGGSRVRYAENDSSTTTLCLPTSHLAFVTGDSAVGKVRARRYTPHGGETYAGSRHTRAWLGLATRFESVGFEMDTHVFFFVFGPFPPNP